MRKYLLIVSFIILAVPVFSFAQTLQEANPCQPGYQGTQLCNAIPKLGGVPIKDITGFISAAFVWLGTVIGTLALVMIIYSGAQMIIAQGDPAAITKAKTSFTYSIFGLLVIMFGYVIVSAFQYFVGVNNLGDPNNAATGFFVNPLRNPILFCPRTNVDCDDSYITSTIRDFLGLLGSLALIYIIISGYRYVTSAGNEQQATKAKSSITWAILGLISCVLSYVILTAVINTIRP
jgi:hypothetical protein